MQVDDAALRDYLVDSGMLTRRQLGEVVPHKISLYEVLAKQGVLSHDELRRAAAGALGTPFVVLEGAEVPAEALALIPEPLSRAHNIVAFKTNGASVEVAMLDLDAMSSVHFLQMERGLRLLPRLTTAGSIKHALLAYHRHLKERFGAKMRGGNVQSAADALIAHALLHHASSVHLEGREFLSGQGELLVRYRINGTLYDAMTLPPEAADIASRFKELAGLSHTLHSAQEGSFKVADEAGQEVRVRVATLPTLRGERVLLHLTKSVGGIARKGFTLSSLGLHGEALEAMHQALNMRSGLIVVSGPAGKTTALYTMLDMLTAKERAIVTVEESIASALPHVAQTLVQSEFGLDAAAALRAVLTQDPDVVMLDAPMSNTTLSLAASAAARGALVLVAAPEAPVQPAADVVLHSAVLRRVCQRCKEEYKLSRAESEPFDTAGANFGKVLAALKEEGVVEGEMQWKDLTFARAVGCSECTSGYSGRIGVQGVEVKGETRGLSIVEDALFKAAAGGTTIEEASTLL